MPQLAAAGESSTASPLWASSSACFSISIIGPSFTYTGEYPVFSAASFIAGTLSPLAITAFTLPSNASNSGAKSLFLS